MQPPPDLAALLPSANALLRTDFEFGRWSGGETVNGVTQFHYFVFSDEASAFISAASEGNWVRPEINWSGPSERERYQRLRTKAGAIERADVQDIAHMLTTLIRGDRFNEGMLAKAFEEGVIHRILARVSEIAENGNT